MMGGTGGWDGDGREGGFWGKARRSKGSGAAEDPAVACTFIAQSTFLC